MNDKVSCIPNDEFQEIYLSRFTQQICIRLLNVNIYCNYVLLKQIHAYRSLSLSDYTSHVFQRPLFRWLVTHLCIYAQQTSVIWLVPFLVKSYLTANLCMKENTYWVTFICLVLYKIERFMWYRKKLSDNIQTILLENKEYNLSYAIYSNE